MSVFTYLKIKFYFQNKSLEFVPQMLQVTSQLHKRFDLTNPYVETLQLFESNCTTIPLSCQITSQFSCVSLTTCTNDPTFRDSSLVA